MPGPARAAYYGDKPALANASTVDAVADAVALTSAAATGGDAPTEAEYNALRTDVSNLRTKVNAILAALRTAGILES
jgi:hypothetical protein